RTRSQLEDGSIIMCADAFPAFLWAGNPPGHNFNEDNMLDGLFKGYLLLHVATHIFKGPSTALGSKSCRLRPCNAVLHDMVTVEPEHIAYTCVLSQNCMSSRKWHMLDGAFDYCAFYYNIIDLLRANQDWFQSLQQHWNMYALIIL
ncbi:hypothetical protein SCLCIDRAFT_134426, partial [Scleroderma citrinum Foug A]